MSNTTHDKAGGKPSFGEWLKHELRHGLVLFLYLWALLGLFVLNEDLVHRAAGNHMVLQGFAFVNALALTKVMMTLEYLDLSRGLSKHRRVVRIVADALISTLAFMAFHVIERVVLGLIRGETVSASMPSFGGGGLGGLIIVGLIFFVSLLPFFTFKAIAQAIGPERVWSILFDRQTKS
jgi:hypothetical protein